MSDLPFPVFHSGTQSNDAGTVVPRPAKPLRLDRLPASKAEIREALRKIYDKAGDDPPNVNRAWDLIKLEMLHVRRSRVREVLDEKGFARQRREPGKKQISVAGIGNCSTPNMRRLHGGTAPSAGP